jgi:hypothetical protein
MRLVVFDFVSRGRLPDNLYLSEYATREDVNSAYIAALDAAVPNDWGILKDLVFRRTGITHPIKTPEQRSQLLDTWLEIVIRDS